MNGSKPIITIDNKGAITLHETVTIGDILNLLDTARQGVLNTQIVKKKEVKNELDPGEPQSRVSENA